VGVINILPDLLGVNIYHFPLIKRFQPIAPNTAYNGLLNILINHISSGPVAWLGQFNSSLAILIHLTTKKSGNDARKVESLIVQNTLAAGVC